MFGFCHVARLWANCLYVIYIIPPNQPCCHLAEDESRVLSVEHRGLSLATSVLWKAFERTKEAPSGAGAERLVR
jgi:hypothetical protein